MNLIFTGIYSFLNTENTNLPTLCVSKNIISNITSWWKDQLSCHAGHQEVGRCCTRSESGNVLHIHLCQMQIRLPNQLWNPEESKIELMSPKIFKKLYHDYWALAWIVLSWWVSFASFIHLYFFPNSDLALVANPSSICKVSWNVGFLSN